MEKPIACLNRLKTFIHGLKESNNHRAMKELACKGELSGMHCMAFDCENCPYVEEKAWEELDDGKQNSELL